MTCMNTTLHARVRVNLFLDREPQPIISPAFANQVASRLLH